MSDLDKIENEVCFASNRIDMAFDATAWRPTYYSVVDEYVALQNENAIRAVDGPLKFFPHTFNFAVPPFEDGHYFRYNMPPNHQERPGFGTDPTVGGFYSGSTVTYVLLQLALYMGFKDVYMLGLDFSFTRPASSSGDNNIVEAQNEQNHFHKNYRKSGEIWQYPNMNHQRMAFEKALKAYSGQGASIRNASRYSALDTFARVNFDDII